MIPLGVPAAGKNAYTTLSRSEGSVYVVKKATYILDEKNNLMWVEDDEPLSITIEKKSFASGKMKNAFKVWFVSISSSHRSLTHHRCSSRGPHTPQSVSTILETTMGPL
jgi:hypothetical protein